MKRFKEDPLLEELFAGEDLEALRRRSLEASLIGLQRKRVNNRLGKMALLIPALLVVGLVLRLTPSHHHKHEPTKPDEQFASVSPSPPATKIISERELFALFRNRPMVLIGKPGHQQVVFLDEPAAEKN